VKHARTAALLTALVAAVASTVSTTGGVALADPSITSARTQAQAIAGQVAALQTQVEVATEQYDAVQEQLAQVVSAYLQASQSTADLSALADQQRMANVARIQALYKSGGQLGLLAQVLAGTDINDVLSRYVEVSHILAADSRALAGSNGQLNQATAHTDALSTLADRRVALQAQAQLAQARILGLLDERRAQLDSANSLVARLVAADQARTAAAAAAAAAATLGTTLTPPPLPPGTPAAVAAAIAAARSVLGAPYQWGGVGPSSWDCSGLTQWAYARAGVALPRTAAEQWNSGSHPALTELQPGDLLFWATNPLDPASIHHVALYLGGGYMIEAPHPGAFVQLVPVYLDGYYGATRPVPAGPGTPGTTSLG